MINLIRIDERLLHGQVAYAWTRHLGINCILVANDQVVNNELSKISLNLAKPADVDLIVKNINDSITFLKGNESKELKILVIINNTNDAVKLAENIAEIKEINIGGMKMRPGKKMLTHSVAVDENDINNIKRLIDMKIEVEICQVPTEKKKMLKDLLK